MKKGIVLITLLVSTALWAVEEMPNLVDPRDKQVYKTVQIGEQVAFEGVYAVGERKGV